MSQPLHSADPQPVVRLAVLTGTICSPSQSHTHTHTHTDTHAHTNTDTTHTRTRTHRPAACCMVPARGRLLHLSLSNLSPLAQQQLAPISSPLGPAFIRETAMSSAACGRLTSTSHQHLSPAPLTSTSHQHLSPAPLTSTSHQHLSPLTGYSQR